MDELKEIRSRINQMDAQIADLFEQRMRASREVMDLLCALNAQGRTVVLITHDPTVAARAQRRVQVTDGRITDA